MKSNSVRARAKKMMILDILRLAVQVVCFVFIPALFSQAYAGVKELIGNFGGGTVIDFSSMFLIRLAVLCAVTIVAGRVFCGWACAFGAIGDWIYRFCAWIQKKTKKKWVKIPDRAIPVLQKLKYIVLAGTLLLCFFGKSSLITKYSPWTVFSLLTARNFRIGAYGVGIALFVLILVGMALQERFFCQFLCPMGAIFSLLPEIPFTALRRQHTNCIPNCQACKKNCPVSVKLQEDTMRDGECIRCGRCSFICPRSNIRPCQVIVSEQRKPEDKKEKMAS